MDKVDVNEIQGIILRGYGKFDISCFVLLHVTNAPAARTWLGRIAPTVNTANRQGDYDTNPKPHPVLNIAFTYAGLLALGLQQANTRSFVNEFREGMVTAHRQRLLGDVDQSDPTLWRWGGPKNDVLHIMLCLYATDQPAMDAFRQKVAAEFEGAGLKVIGRLDGLTLEGRREHFGFRDGIGQPKMDGYDENTGDPSPENHVAPGEFLLGYPNEYGVYPDTPTIAQPQGDLNLLKSVAAGSGLKDLGRNGTYFVFRQMSQDVKGFWSDLSNRTRNNDGSDNSAARIQLASKMVGRWPSGAPITRYPTADPGGLSDEDNFGFREHDPIGEQCPIGSHVRRTNPRDGLQDSTSAQSTKITNHHRLLRRGRAYGPMFARSMHPDDLLTAPQPAEEVGLLFMCFNANIANQFDFVQANWAGSEKFEKFYNDPDPLMGVQRSSPIGPAQFTIQASPVRKIVPNLKRYVEVRGGAFMFMPSISAIRFLASIGD
ncbi:MAG TPA: Dyp-type peroxidase [Humisphaera sp.]|jgi:Dyp-type peroxidase family|nr:Dyp-type peroxidase [Humisphaera sp.]